MSKRWIPFVIVGIVAFALFSGLVKATHDFLTEPFPGHNDFLSRWEGTRSFWIDGLNPYGEEASLNIQNHMLGRPATENEDQVLFAYPMYTAILIAPLVLVNYAWASAIMMVIMEVMLVIALFLLLDLFKWRPGALTLALLIVASLFSYFPARGLILGQLGLVSYFMYVLAFWSLKKDRDRIAGIALALATIKPQLGFLIIPFLLLWGIKVKRWQFIGAFAVSMGILVSVSFILVPTWLVDMWQQVANYTGYAPPSAGEMLFEEALGLPSSVRYITYILLWIPMLIGWYQVLIQGKLERAMWVAMLTFTITNTASPVIATPHFVVFFIPLIFYLKHLSKIKRGNLWFTLLLLFLLVEPWIRFLMTIDAIEKLENAAWMTYPEAIVILLSLWFMRHLWWEQGNILEVAD